MPKYDPVHDLTPVEPVSTERDLLAQRHAAAQADELTAWWHSRGFPTAQFWIEKAPLPHRLRAIKGGLWIVRSKNGIPPKS
jgi:hypothetical protein